ncbi:hypothetical protein [Clostridium sp.]|uniref:hypothetical protein n=1 Tax=Clostridium sp. TaxID=1506 RepID=UPI0028FE63EF|nr:hypothetical protein [Clostridium sp.]MDU1032546.1 hypothetical protein [Clostridium sp.]
MRDYKLTLNLVTNEAPGSKIFKQYDTGNEIELELYQNEHLNADEKLVLTDESVLAFFKRQDGQVLQKNCTVRNGNVIVTTSKDVLGVPGVLELECLVKKGDVETTTTRMTFTVQESIARDGAIEEDPRYTSDLVTELLDVRDNVKSETIGKIEEVASQLEDKANKNEVFTMANMGQDIKEAISGGSVAVVGRSSVGIENVKTNAIHAYHTSFLKVSSDNILNPSICKNGFYVSPTNGDLVTDSAYITSDFIKITPGKTYYSNSGNTFAFYDNVYNFISGGNTNEMIAPPNACFLRKSINKDIISQVGDIRNIYIVINDKKPTQLGVYPQFEIEVDKLKPISKIENSSITETKVKPKSIGTYNTSFLKVISDNILNPNNCIDNYYISSKDGGLVRDTNFVATDFIEVITGTTYYSNSGINFAFYDDVYNFISSGNDNIMVAPPNACFLRKSINKDIIKQVGGINKIYIVPIDKKPGKGEYPQFYLKLEGIEEINEQELLLIDNIPNSISTTEDKNDVLIITHKDKSSKKIIRIDTIIVNDNYCTETRTLSKGRKVTIKTDLDNLEVEVF